MMRVLRGRAKPLGESRRRRLVPCCVDDVCNSLVLQRRRGRGLLRKELGTMLLISVHNSGGVLRDGAIMLRVFDRLIEQDKVLLVVWQIELLKLLLMCRLCRQARRTGGKPC